MNYMIREDLPAGAKEALSAAVSQPTASTSHDAAVATQPTSLRLRTPFLRGAHVSPHETKKGKCRPSFKK